MPFGIRPDAYAGDTVYSVDNIVFIQTSSIPYILHVDKLIVRYDYVY